MKESIVVSSCASPAKAAVGGLVVEGGRDRIDGMQRRQLLNIACDPVMRKVQRDEGRCAVDRLEEHFEEVALQNRNRRDRHRFTHFRFLRRYLHDGLVLLEWGGG
jgi:hypothetical protein